MVNKKRDKNAYKNMLGRYRLDYQNVLDIEQMLRVYADAKEMKVAGIESMPEGLVHMPRRYTDRNVKIGRYSPFHIEIGRNEFGIYYPDVEYIYDADSVKLLPKHIKRSSYVQIECHPGITITFRPFSTEVYAQTHYATGKELMIMKRVIADIEDYITSLEKAVINIINLAA